MTLYEKWKEVKAFHEDRPDLKVWFQFIIGLAIGSLIIIPVSVWMIYHMINHHGLLEKIVRCMP